MATVNETWAAKTTCSPNRMWLHLKAYKYENVDYLSRHPHNIRPFYNGGKQHVAPTFRTMATAAEIGLTEPGVITTPLSSSFASKLAKQIPTRSPALDTYASLVITSSSTVRKRALLL